jgi:two-component system, OmpR family, sensor histidine kinase ChvG
MALDFEGPSQSGGTGAPAAGRILGAGPAAPSGLVTRARETVARLDFGGWVRSQPVWRFFTKSIARRILATNLIVASVLLLGTLFINQNHNWLRDAKMESLRTQGEIIASAIASDAKLETDRIVVDLDKMLEGDASFSPLRDDTLSSLRLSLAPERVTPLLRRLVQLTTARARIYDREGTLVADSAQFNLTKGQVVRSELSAPNPGPQAPVQVKSPWTRFLAWVIRGDLPVYHEIGAANGKFYPQVREALNGATGEMLLLDENNNQIVTVTAPIKNVRAILGVLVLSTRPGEIDKTLWQERRMYLWLGGVALGATLLAGWLLNRTIAGPMHRLSEIAEQVSHNISSRRSLPDMSTRADEVGQIAVAYRNMTEALYQRIEASDRFAQDVAHELKNPLTAARATAESLGYAKTDAQRQELMKQFQGELKRLNRLITDISNASRLDADLARKEIIRFDISDILKGVVQVFRDIHGEGNFRVSLSLEESAGSTSQYLVDGHEGRLGQVITNLVDNALSFSPAGGAVTVVARRAGSEIEIAVEDQGPGIPESSLDDVFKRFYSDRPQTDRTMGKNSGLGLSISREIVEAHGGRIWAENRKARDGETIAHHDQAELEARRIPNVAGARFVFRLPAAAGAPGRGGNLVGRRA